MAFDDRPFQDYYRYAQIHCKVAVTEKGEIVKVRDWARNDPETDLRVLVVAYCAPGETVSGLAWEVREDRLAPVPSVQGALEYAAQWRARRQASQLSCQTASAGGQRATRRI